MDKYIKMLLIRLSQRYRVTIITTMYYSEDTGRIGNAIKLRISDKNKKTLCSKELYGKRALIGEMMMWLKD